MSAVSNTHTEYPASRKYHTISAYFAANSVNPWEITTAPRNVAAAPSSLNRSNFAAS